MYTSTSAHIPYTHEQNHTSHTNWRWNYQQDSATSILSILKKGGGISNEHLHINIHSSTIQPSGRSNIMLVSYRIPLQEVSYSNGGCTGMVGRETRHCCLMCIESQYQKGSGDLPQTREVSLTLLNKMILKKLVWR